MRRDYCMPKSRAHLSRTYESRCTLRLTTLCNILNVPILFVGTPAAMKVLGRDFRIALRATGLALSKWERLPLYDDAGPDNLSEWAEFTMALSKYQWVKQPLEFDSGSVSIFVFEALEA